MEIENRKIEKADFEPLGIFCPASFGKVLSPIYTEATKQIKLTALSRAKPEMSKKWASLKK